MTVHKPDAGEIFYDHVLSTRLRYVGSALEGAWIMEGIDQEGPTVSSLRTVTPEYARKNLVTWTEELIKLEPMQLWTRTRNDYSDRAAVILSVIDFHGTLYVVYEEINGHGENPKLKKEIDFRRVYGRLAHRKEDDA